ncbi:MAG: pyruvate dehydrogenase (acetyl-transferring) E1 component subunit alpha [Bacillaceae bacterium]|nr:pyruvate dehydrogenase (acetyl-transferring) E1 component subunit alpha [Bacillaceae bacterium]
MLLERKDISFREDELEFQQLQVLKENGEINHDWDPGLSDDKLRDIYSWMVKMRILDGRSIKLNRQGRLGFYAPMGGQEAAMIASIAALNRDDYALPSYRDVAVSLYHGLPLTSFFQGSRGEMGGSWPDVNVLPPQIIIAAQVTQCAGVAWGLKLKGEKKVAICYFGDGATSQGDFHEGLNFAAVHKVPAIFFCQNNLYAISVPLTKQTASDTLAQKAVAYGMPGVQVDGNDALAVYRAVHDAAERARRGEGPTLIEAVTYRHGPHTMAGDDPSRYRKEEELDEWQQRDPIHRLRTYLEKKGIWSDEDQQRVEEEMKQEISNAMDRLGAMGKSNVLEIFDLVYSETPEHLKEQRQELEQILKGGKS